VAGGIGLPAGHEAQRSLEEADVPVGLRRVGGYGGVVRANSQIGLIWAIAPKTARTPNTKKNRAAVLAMKTG